MAQPRSDPFEALADPHRRALVGMLRHEDLSVGAMAARLPISRPAVSRHLRILAGAGLVTHRTEGTRHLYSLDHAGVDEVRRFLDEVWGDAITRFTMFAENTAPPAGGQAETS